MGLIRLKVELGFDDVWPVIGGEGTRLSGLVKKTEKLLKESKALLDPVFVYKEFSVEEITASDIVLEGGCSLGNRVVAKFTKGAERAVLFACTVGSRLEEKASAYGEQGEAVKAYILDAIGSVAVDRLASTACNYLAEKVYPGEKVSPLFTPGQNGWKIEDQKLFFQLLQPEKAGIRLKPSLIMLPKKSMSCLIGVGKELQETAHDVLCYYCALKRQNCSLSKTRLR